MVRKLTILSSYSRLKTEEIAKAYRINPRTLFRWISQFKDQGVEGLVDKPKGHKPAFLTYEMKRQLVQWITTQKDSDGKQVSWTLDKLRVEEEIVYSVKISKSRKNEYPIKRTRPTHIMADKKKQAEYKKNSKLPEGKS